MSDAGITVIVPVSVILSHPSTEILSETLDSVRFHLPDCELFVTFDGVRPEQADRQADYDEFTRRALWLLDKKYGCAVPYLFDTHQHQTGMLRHIIDDIRTDLLLYVEADTPLCTDVEIDWECAASLVECGNANVVRFHHEAVIPKEHEHMMCGDTIWSRACGGPIVEFVQTCQWSQRPHIASVAYYRRILESHFSPDAKCFIEDRMHSVCHEAYKLDGMQGWNQHRLHIYAPKGGNIKRSYHLDGRAGGKKFDESQTW